MLFFKKSLKQLVTEYHVQQEEKYLDMNTRRSTGSNIRIKINNSSSKSYAMAGSLNKNLTPEWYEKNAKICGLVSQHPYMYDRSHPDYMRKSSVDNAWQEISESMHDSVKKCKERWRNIRTSFARSINVHSASGSNRMKPYYLTNELQFLKKHITPGVPIPIRGRRSRASNIDPDDDDDDDDDDDEDDADDEAIEEEDVKLTVEINKHSLSSNENSRDSSHLASDAEHAQINNDNSSRKNNNNNNGVHCKKEHEEMLGQSTGDESYQTSNRACPPKKRQRLNLEKNKLHDPKEKIQTPNCITSVPPQQAPAPATAIDFDDAFLQSLRPEIKHMNFHQKLYFKRRVYDLLGEILQNNEEPSPLHDHQKQQQQQQQQQQMVARSILNGGGGVSATPSGALQHLGLTLQLPKLMPRTTKES
ncbi:probable serine/threonine-protein kinase mps1 isoform X1 [Drosophila tropicalis]|uniref:probable serine/threonine-protein kinase mps1 isoform X1 n=2 Tax=Drosophila tropicalis TaxID=46794 RepID=UPI0035AC1359